MGTKKTHQEILQETVIKNCPPHLTPFTQGDWDKFTSMEPEQHATILEAMQTAVDQYKEQLKEKVVVLRSNTLEQQDNWSRGWSMAVYIC